MAATKDISYVGSRVGVARGAMPVPLGTGDGRHVMMPRQSTLSCVLTCVEIHSVDPCAQSAAPRSPRLSLEATLSRGGMFDGAWWPRSRDVRAELPGLISALTARLGTILRVGLDIDAWDEAPRRLTVDGRVVLVDWSPAGDDTMSATRGGQDHFLLLVIPPQATVSGAAAATRMAVRTGNCALAADILAAAGITCAIAGPVPAPLTAAARGQQAWESEGGRVVRA